MRTKRRTLTSVRAHLSTNVKKVIFQKCLNRNIKESFYKEMSQKFS